jgi:hypothetical protein
LPLTKQIITQGNTDNITKYLNHPKVRFEVVNYLGMAQWDNYDSLEHGIY